MLFPFTIGTLSHVRKPLIKLNQKRPVFALRGTVIHLEKGYSESLDSHISWFIYLLLTNDPKFILVALTRWNNTEHLPIISYVLY